MLTPLVVRGIGGIPLIFMQSERHYRDEIVRYGHMLHDQFFVAATDGNLSVRLDDGSILCTPTCLSKGMMTPDDLVIVNSQGEMLRGHRPPSSEIAMHVLIYRMRPDVNAVVHAHPPTATGFAAAGVPLTQPLVSEIVIALGEVPLAPYATPGSPELSESLRPLVHNHDAILMANHGVVTYSSDLNSAYMKMETVEHFARVVLVTHQLGCQQLLSESEVRKLNELGRRYLENGAAKRPVSAAAAGPIPAVGNEPR